MKTIHGIILIGIFVLIGGNNGYTGFDDILKDVLLESTQPIGSEEYVFNPGDTVISGSFQTLRKLSDGDVVKIEERSLTKMREDEN